MDETTNKTSTEGTATEGTTEGTATEGTATEGTTEGTATEGTATDAGQDTGAGKVSEKAPTDAAVSDFEKRYLDLEKRYEEQGKRFDALLESVAKLVNANVRLGAVPGDAPKRIEPTADEKALDALMGE